MVADGLELDERNTLSKLLRNEKSDSCFRLNHYLPCPELQLLSGRNLIGFREHTDPQIISVLRSNNTAGLQICLKDGTWVSIPPDQTSFFFSVGDCLQPQAMKKQAVLEEEMAYPYKIGNFEIQGTINERT